MPDERHEERIVDAIDNSELDEVLCVYTRPQKPDYPAEIEYDQERQDVMAEESEAIFTESWTRYGSGRED